MQLLRLPDGSTVNPKYVAAVDVFTVRAESHNVRVTVFETKIIVGEYADLENAEMVRDGIANNIQTLINADISAGESDGIFRTQLD